VNVFYVSVRTTENYEFDKISTAGVTGNATNYKNSQGDNSIICSTRDEISQTYREFSPRAATATTFCRPFVHYACLILCSEIVHLDFYRPT